MDIDPFQMEPPQEFDFAFSLPDFQKKMKNTTTTKQLASSFMVAAVNASVAPSCLGLSRCKVDEQTR